MIDLARFSSTPKCNEFVELSAKIADLKPAIARAAFAWDHFGLKIVKIGENIQIKSKYKRKPHTQITKQITYNVEVAPLEALVE